jgi:hypothetical protein
MRAEKGEFDEFRRMCRRQSVLGCEVDKLSVESEYPAVRGFAQAGHVLGDGIEYRLGIAGRVGDDAEHFGGRSLLLQRLNETLLCLSKFAGPLVELLLEVGGGGAATTRIC